MSGLVFSLTAWGEMWLWIVPYNREGTEETTKVVLKVYQAVVSDLEHGIAACVSGVV